MNHCHSYLTKRLFYLSFWKSLSLSSLSWSLAPSCNKLQFHEPSEAHHKHLGSHSDIWQVKGAGRAWKPVPITWAEAVPLSPVARTTRTQSIKCSTWGEQEIHASAESRGDFCKICCMSILGYNDLWWIYVLKGFMGKEPAGLPSTIWWKQWLAQHGVPTHFDHIQFLHYIWHHAYSHRFKKPNETGSSQGIPDRHVRLTRNRWARPTSTNPWITANWSWVVFAYA